jgi:protocatechuate 3,4-dioxygenase beta subunit
MDGSGGSADSQDVAAALRARLALCPPGRLASAVGLILDHAFAVLDTLAPTEAELDALVQFLTDVGYATDARRQEWVLLADVFGLTARVATPAAHPAATPATLPGPFYRPDAPDLPDGADLCRDGQGTPLRVTGHVTDVQGRPVAGAGVEVWHANAAGRYENQDPDNQPEHNLRGRLRTDAAGRFAFRSIRPGGYALPGDGPVGALAQRLGLSLDRPAHIHFAVNAPGHPRLVTAIFDGSDPAIGRDALFAVRPELVGTIRQDGPVAHLDVTLVLGPPGHPHQQG